MTKEEIAQLAILLEKARAAMAHTDNEGKVITPDAIYVNNDGSLRGEATTIHGCAWISQFTLKEGVVSYNTFTVY